MIRLVVDSNVVISGLLWGGIPAELIRMGTSRRCRFVSSPPILAEVLEVVSRKKFGDALVRAKMDPHEVILRYAGMAEIVEPGPTVPIAPDADDDIIIATAVSGAANYLVTGDGGLLSVGAFRGGKIVTPRAMVETLKMLRSV